MTDPEMADDRPTPDASATPDSAALARAESDAAAEAAAGVPAEPDATTVTDGLDAGLTSNDYTVAFSPRQVAVGLAIVAGLVAVVAARRRGRRHTGEDG
jgi:hypothetical protein